MFRWSILIQRILVQFVNMIYKSNNIGDPNDQESNHSDRVPFRFKRDVATVQEVWYECLKFFEYKRRDLCLEYINTRDREYQSEKRFINHSLVFAKEIEYAMNVQSIDVSQAIEQLSTELSKMKKQSTVQFQGLKIETAGKDWGREGNRRAAGYTTTALIYDPSRKF
ncbi:hypothetical protein BGZ76_000061 [Entomortierella beljakovae]|nr:hypothetical protein BGZ76_000061 [Entomortierella beljakovae]